MSRRRPSAAPPPSPPPSQRAPSPSAPVDRWRAVGLTAVGAVMTTRTLFPSEDASSGSGLCVVLLELGLVGLVLLDALLSPRRFDRPSSAVALAPWAWLAAGVVWASASTADYYFAAQVAAWEWTGLAAVWTAAAWFSRGVGPRPLLAVLTALCLAEAGCAFWQVGVEYPDLRRRYEARDPIVMDEVRRTIGVEPGSPEA
ncbi:MAG: hypothetical protein ACRC1K_12780, partial [Planctomycetia bacterium]